MLCNKKYHVLEVNSTSTSSFSYCNYVFIKWKSFYKRGKLTAVELFNVLLQFFVYLKYIRKYNDKFVKEMGLEVLPLSTVVVQNF